jgi:hypothetical protein
MVHKWTDAFAASMAGEQGVHVYQLSVVENTVMSMPGFRNMLLAGGRELERQAAARLAATGVTGAASALPLRVNYSFGDSYTLRSALRIQTRLTTYVAFAPAVSQRYFSFEVCVRIAQPPGWRATPSAVAPCCRPLGSKAGVHLGELVESIACCSL